MPRNTRASTLDLVSLWMDTDERPLDFGVITTLDGGVRIEALLSGARSARRAFPRAHSILAGGHWRESEVDAGELLANGLAEGEGERQRCIETFLEAPLDPSIEPPLRQLILHGERRGTIDLVTRCHHAAADLMSVVLFLDHQLKAMRAPIQKGDVREEPPVLLRTHEDPVRKSRYAQRGPSSELWRRRRQPGRTRRVRSLSIDAAEPRRLVASCAQGRFTYNDLLGAAALVMIRRFQEEHAGDVSRLSLWFPVSARVHAWRGFGNGSSRIRVYDRSSAEASMCDRAAAFREQVTWSKEHGEWAVPESHPLLRLPEAIRWPVLRSYFRRPWVDMGTMLFSHAERLGAAGDLLLDASHVEVIANLDRRHAAGLAGVTLREETLLSLTFDPALLDVEDVDRLLHLYRAVIAETLSELRRCAV